MQSELINDNALLEYTADHGYMMVTVRYVNSTTSGIREHVLIRMNIVEFMKHQQHLLQMNEDHSAIAIFKPTKDGYALDGIYNTQEHEFGMPDFLDLEYKKAFSKGTIEKTYIKKIGQEE